MNKIHNFQSLLLKKIQLAETIYQLEYKAPDEFIFTAGQFVGARVLPSHTRAYSIANFKDGVITLLIDIKPMGIASKYFLEVQEGAFTQMLGPYGIYKAKDTNLPKVFISTGTGIAPFIPIIGDLVRNKPDVKLYNFYGSKTYNEDIAFPFFKDLLNDNFKFINCITREDVSVLKSENENHQILEGRVTHVIPQYNLDWVNTEFYICGGVEMINNMSVNLKALGADKIFVEKY